MEGSVLGVDINIIGKELLRGADINHVWQKKRIESELSGNGADQCGFDSENALPLANLVY
jgi:hypothetical protein